MSTAIKERISFWWEVFSGLFRMLALFFSSAAAIWLWLNLEMSSYFNICLCLAITGILGACWVEQINIFLAEEKSLSQKKE